MGVSELKIIELLEKVGPQGIAQSEIYKILGLSKSWVSELLSSMERRGIITRSKGPGKTLIVRLSRYGDPSISRTLTIGLVPSVEYLSLPLLMKKAREWGYLVEPSIKRSVLEVAVSFIRGGYHLAYLPIYMLPLLKALGIGFKVIGSVALGGASIIGRDFLNIRSIFSSMLSTMEILSVAYIRATRSITSHSEHRIRYYRDPDSVIESLARGGEGIAMTWEPYSSIAEIRGLKKIPASDILGEYHCCVLIARDDIPSEIMSKIRRAHISSIEELPHHIDSLLYSFSELIGIPRTIIKKGYREYIFTHQIDANVLRNITRNAEGFLINSELLEDIVRTNDTYQS